MEQRRQLAQKQWRKFADHFGDPYKNIGDIKIEKEPQDRSGSIDWLFRSDMAEKKAKANIQDVEIHLVKIDDNGWKSNRAILDRIQKVGASASRTHPEKGRAGNIDGN